MKEIRETEVKKESQTEQFHSSRDISIWIDNYEDMFSDFDPRDFSEREISDDFLRQLKKVANESDFPISELKLLIPGKGRSVENENVIIKRLHSHFRKNNNYYIDRKKSENRKGLLLTLIGLAMMVGASYVSSTKSDNFIMHVLFVMLEPAGWFLVWVGLDNIVYLSRERKPELDFYNKMSKSKIVFVSI